MKHYKGIKTLEVLEGADNYNKWIVSRIRRYIKSPAIEIGAGTGNISGFLKNLKELVVTDNDPQLVDLLRDKFKKNKNITVEVLDVEKKLGNIKNQFQTAYLVNVLEHIKDDSGALVNIYSLLKENGYIVILVPAKKNAYTALDKKLGHYRRYERNELKNKLEEANFKIEYIEFFNMVGLVSWIMRTILTREQAQLKRGHVKLFDWIVPLLKYIEPSRGLPAGISLIAVGKKVIYHK